MLQLQISPNEKDWITFVTKCQDPAELQKILDFVNTPDPERVLTQFETQVLFQIAKNAKASSKTLLDLSRRITYEKYSYLLQDIPTAYNIIHEAITSFHYDLLLHPKITSEILIEIYLNTNNPQIKKHVLQSCALDPLHRELIELGLV